MGRKTWESIPPKFRPLRRRVNVILSRGATPDDHGSRQSNGGAVQSVPSAVDTHFSTSLEAALAMLGGPEFGESIETIFVIGGGQVTRHHILQEAARVIDTKKMPIHIYNKSSLCEILVLFFNVEAAWK